MDFKRPITTLWIFIILFLFTQCEKEEMIFNEADQTTFAENTQDLHAKKGDNPAKPDQPAHNYATVNKGLEETAVIYGEGWIPGPFTLTLSSDYFDEDDAGTFTVTGFVGDPKTTADDDRIRIMYTTKKNGENRIDLWYEDDGIKKCFVIRQSNPNNAYDGANTLTLNADYIIVAIRDGTGEHYTDYAPELAPVFAEVKLSYQPFP